MPLTSGVSSYGRSCGRGRVFTYFFQAFWGGPIKIGKAVDPIRRHASVQTGYPYELKIVGLIEGDRERELHERWADHRLNGEWFEPVPDVAADIDHVLREHRGDRFQSDAVVCSALKCKGWHPKVRPLWGDPCRNPPQFAHVHRDTLRRSPVPSAPAAPRRMEGEVRT